ncbi:MAG TPA: hypothetical protein VM871_07400, partial [Flavisolibacter sp.]|nr:hypothetical protein [Flavisolibacter sp.]
SHCFCCSKVVEELRQEMDLLTGIAVKNLSSSPVHADYKATITIIKQTMSLNKQLPYSSTNTKPPAGFSVMLLLVV